LFKNGISIILFESYLFEGLDQKVEVSQWGTA
jgi:hypothetical protein